MTFTVVKKMTGWIIAAVLVAAAAGLLVATVPVFGNTALIVRSGSMQPAIGVGDLVVVRERSAGYRVGDVIAFQSGGKSDVTVTHRIVGVHEEAGSPVYETKGDANEEPDAGAVYSEWVLGRQIVVVPYVGKILSVGKSRGGFLSFVIVPALLIMAGDIRAIWQEIGKRRAREKQGTGERETAAAHPPHTTPPPVPAARERAVTPALWYRFPARVPIDSVVVKLALLVVSISLVVPSAHALYADSEVSAGNVFAAAACFATDEYADEVVDVSDGGTFGHCCDASNLSSDPAVAEPLVVGAPDSPPDTDFIQISDNSYVTVRFADNVGVLSGDANPDLRIFTYDDLFEGRANVYVSDDCSVFHLVGDFSDVQGPNNYVDIDADGFGAAAIQCVRIEDLFDAEDPFPTLGFDLDAVAVLDSELDCEETQ